MKNKTFFILTVLMLLLVLPHAPYAGETRSKNTIKIMSGQTIVAGGTSTYMIDLKDNRYYPILLGEPFSLQFSGVSCAAGSATPAAKINAAYRMSNHFPSGDTVTPGLFTGAAKITSKLESTNIVTNLAHDSGNTEYTYDFFPQKGRYLIIDISAGAVPMITSVYIDLD